MSDLFSSETAVVGCLGLWNIVSPFFAGFYWLTSTSRASESSSGGGGVRF